MKKISFNLKYKEDIIDGEVKVITDCGEPVEIVKWDCKGNCPILAVIDDGDTHDSCFFKEDGSSLNEKDCLYLLVDEPEMTEFEKEYLWLVHKLSPEDILPQFIEQHHLRENCNRLLEIACKEFKKDLPKWRITTPNYAGKVFVPDNIIVVEFEGSRYEIVLKEILKLLPKEE